jgi:hypothetical protein
MSARPVKPRSGRTSLGLMAICYEQPGRTGSSNRLIRYAEQGWV